MTAGVSIKYGISNPTEYVEVMGSASVGTVFVILAGLVRPAAAPLILLPAGHQTEQCVTIMGGVIVGYVYVNTHTQADTVITAPSVKLHV